MKPRTIIILIAVLLVCAGAIIVRQAVVRHRASSKAGGKEAAASAEKDVLSAKPGEPKKLIVASADGRKTVFDKALTDWRIVEPVSAKAEAWRVSDITDAFKDLKGKVVDAASKEITGLDNPLWTVTLVDDKDASHTLEIGLPRPLETSQTYVRPQGGHDAYVVKVDFASKLSRPLRDYRSKSVLDLNSDDIADIKVTGRVSFELTRSKAGEWGLAADNVSARADDEKVKGFVDKFARLTAEEFVADKSDDLSSYGLAPGKELLVLRVQMKAEQPAPATAPASGPASAPATAPAKPPKVHTLHLGSVVQEKAYAKLGDQPTIFQVKASLLDDLQPKALDLRDRKVLRVETDDVARVELSLPGGKAELVKANDQWQMLKPFQGKANAEAVRKLLTDIAALKAENFPRNPSLLAAFGLDNPTGTITLHLTGKSETLTLLIGGKSQSGEMTFVKPAASPAVAVVPSAEADKVTGDVAGYWDNALMERPAGANVTHLTLKRPDGTFELTRNKDAWTMGQPIKADVDGDNVRKAVESLETLRANKVVALGTQVPEKYASAKDIITATVTLAVEPATQPTTAPVGTTTAPALPPTTAPVGTTTAPALPPTTAPVGTTMAPATLPAGVPPATTAGAATQAATAPATTPASKPATAPAPTPAPEPASAPATAPAPPAAPPAAPAATQPTVAPASPPPAPAAPPPAPAVAPPAPPATQPAVAPAAPPPAAPASQPAPVPATQPAPLPASMPSTRPAATTRTYTLNVAKVGDNSYVWVEGQKVTAVGEFPVSFYNDLAAELRNRKVLKITPDEVENVKIVSGSETLELRKEKEAWTYVSDPYVKIDAEKVKTFLKDIQDLAADKFVSPAGADAAKFGLDKPKLTAEIKSAKGKVYRVSVSPTGPEKSQDRYGSAAGVEGVFVLPSATVDKLTKSLKDFKSTGETKPPPPPE